MRLGAHYRGNGQVSFKVWAPLARTVETRLVSPRPLLVSMSRDESGYWRGSAEGVIPGTRYLYRLDGHRERPDPASTHQPEGVHAASGVCDLTAYSWGDAGFCPPPFPEWLIYELHVGCFSPAGTFRAIIPRLDQLREMGVNALELMPVSQFPGSRNWGYDGCYPFAAQDSYGGHHGLMELVDEAHQRGMAMILDVVYNHLGPEGNYLHDYGPYFTDRYRTPWGSAVNFDGPGSDEVRAFFIENAARWFSDFHFDALRLDAVHGIVDFSARPFLQELSSETRAWETRLGRRLTLIAESDLNDPRVLRSPGEGGFAMDAQWSDDFHHAVHALFSGERRGYYVDFGEVEQLVRAYRDTFVYAGDYSINRNRRHGAPALDLAPARFVTFIQNHDQVGNRAWGERLSALLNFEAQKVAAAIALLSPHVPLLFMGEEYAEDAPFLYFISHGSNALVQAVRDGRRREFASFGFEEVPDPQAEETFERSKLRWESRTEGLHGQILSWYRELIRLRRSLPGLAVADRESIRVGGLEDEKIFWMVRQVHDEGLFLAANLHHHPQRLTVPELPAGTWEKELESSENIFGGPGEMMPASIAAGIELRLPVTSVAVYIRRGS